MLAVIAIVVATAVAVIIAIDVAIVVTVVVSIVVAIIMCYCCCCCCCYCVCLCGYCWGISYLNRHHLISSPKTHPHITPKRETNHPICVTMIPSLCVCTVSQRLDAVEVSGARHLRCLVCAAAWATL